MVASIPTHLVQELNVVTVDSDFTFAYIEDISARMIDSCGICRGRGYMRVAGYGVGGYVIWLSAVVYFTQLVLTSLHRRPVLI